MAIKNKNPKSCIKKITFNYKPKLEASWSINPVFKWMIFAGINPKKVAKKKVVKGTFTVGQAILRNKFGNIGVTLNEKFTSKITYTKIDFIYFLILFLLDIKFLLEIFIQLYLYIIFQIINNKWMLLKLHIMKPLLVLYRNQIMDLIINLKILGLEWQMIIN